MKGLNPKSNVQKRRESKNLADSAIIPSTTYLGTDEEGDFYKCEACKKEFISDEIGIEPDKCPHCKVIFEYVD